MRKNAKIALIMLALTCIAYTMIRKGVPKKLILYIMQTRVMKILMKWVFAYDY